MTPTALAELSFADSSWLGLLFALPFLWALLVLELITRKRAIRKLFSQSLIPSLASGASATLRIIRATLAILAVAFLIIALARPRVPGGEQTFQAEGRDVVFVVDVSRSMLAQDLSPNRLERSKLWINDVLAAGEGDRFAIVAFAGTPVVAAPLTADTNYLRLVADELSPLAVSRGGTNIGDAIRIATEDVFEDDTAGTRDIILITDGEDQGSLPVEAAKNAAAQGIRIIAIGIGSEDEGVPIPAGPNAQPITFQGSTVLSRLDADTLREMASASQGVYFNVATDTIDLTRVYRQLVRDADRRQLERVDAIQMDELFQWPLAIALALLAAQLLIGERSFRRRQM